MAYPALEKPRRGRWDGPPPDVSIEQVVTWKWQWALVGVGVACVPPDSPSEGSIAVSAPAPHEAVPRLRRAGTGGPAPARVAEIFTDDFGRQALGPDYNTTSPRWLIAAGQLCARGAHNRPLWLRRRLPVNARIDFDAVAASTAGDIKVEAWGDGTSAATTSSYHDATSYIVIFGGWKNHLHAIARLDEHGKDRQAVGVGTSPRAQPVEPHRRYHLTIERRDGRTVRWLVDGAELLRYADDSPLVGANHEYFAFNNWEAPVCFDNLRITPL